LFSIPQMGNKFAGNRLLHTIIEAKPNFFGLPFSALEKSHDWFQLNSLPKLHFRELWVVVIEEIFLLIVGGLLEDMN